MTFALAAAIAGCGGEDQFSIEKTYYWAQKEAQNIYKNPRATPPNEIKRVVGLFEKFSKKYPKGYLAVDAKFTIARIYMLTGDPDAARQQLRSIISDYAKVDTICSEAEFLIGNTYELQDKWSAALAQYKKIEELYPITTRGLEMPIYITQHYKVKYQPDKMIEAGHEAAAHYTDLAARNSDKPALVIRAETLVVECYGMIKEWNTAANALNAMIEKYKKLAPMDGAMMNLALIYSQQLQDNAKAREVLEALIRDYPQSKLIGTAKQAIKKWTP